jgi:hypothetical protein
MIWDAVHGMRLIEQVLMDDYGLDLTGWTLTSVVGVSADGRTIVGQGYNPSGDLDGWIATIPEPGTALLVLAGLVGLAMGRTRRRSI